MRSEKRLLRCTRQIATCKASFASRLATPRWPTASPAMCGGLVRRPQRPGNQARAEARSWRNPPSHSPSRIAGHRRLCRNALAGHTEHLARCQHFAPATRSHQAKTRAPLCRNCGCRRFLVEARGKLGRPRNGPCQCSGGRPRPPAFRVINGGSDGMILRNKFHYVHATTGYRCVILRRNPCARCTNPVRGKNMNGHPSTTLIPFCLQNATASSLTAPVPLAR